MDEENVKCPRCGHLISYKGFFSPHTDNDCNYVVLDKIYEKVKKLEALAALDRLAQEKPPLMEVNTKTGEVVRIDEKPLAEHSLIGMLNQHFPRWSLQKVGLLKWIAFGMDKEGTFLESTGESETPDEALKKLLEGK